MSHFTVYVFSKDRDVEELLAPYNEELVVAPYIKYTKEQAIAKIRNNIEKFKNNYYAEYLKDPIAYKEKCTNESHINYIENEFPKKLNWTDEECYQEMRSWYDDDDDLVDANGNIWDTYNPNSKWDWYTEGGRWNGCLKTKDGNETNEDLVSEIDFDKTPVPFAFVDPLGRWYERGEMGWWAIVTNEKDKDDWETQYKNFVASLNGDETLTIVDCHI